MLALQFLGGVVATIVGAVRLDGTLAFGGLAQVFLAGFLLALGGLSGGGGDVHEVEGADDAFVVRSGQRRIWKQRQGPAKLLHLVRGTTDWAVSVRRRDDDPLGEPILIETTETEAQATARGTEIAHALRTGRLP